MESVKLSVTVRGALERKYERVALGRIDAAIARWVEADARRGLRTVHVALDDAAAMRRLGAPPLEGRPTAHKAKRAIDALWRRLAPEYLVLVGGDDVVPHFRVPNPSRTEGGDDDEEVPTDNPYACDEPFAAARLRDHLVPDRVAGRLPDPPAAGDPAWLLAALETATRWRSRPRADYAGAYAICCDAWKDAGRACVERLGEEAARLLVSPPIDDEDAGARERLAARLHMIKCHGASLDARFYGEKAGRYPIALASATLRPRVAEGTVAGAMCCYGAGVFAPDDPAALAPGEWPVALAYLRQGALGFVGSTTIAWVGFDEMVCADWIVAGFLERVLGGASLGRALLEAKQDYFRWIGQQGWTPHITDEKTQLQFLLLGDPSVHPVAPASAQPGRVAARTAAARPGALLAQERRQRRVFRTGLAAEIREVLPRRTRATPAAPPAARVKRDALAALGAEARGAGFAGARPRIDRVVVDLPAPRTAASGPARRAARRTAPIDRRDSYQYYWATRERADGLTLIRLLRVETDRDGRVVRSSIVESS